MDHGNLWFSGGAVPFDMKRKNIKRIHFGPPGRILVYTSA